MKNNILLLIFGTLIALVCWDCTNSEQHTQEVPSLTAEQKEVYLDRGKQIAASTFTALSQQLQKAVKEGGIPNAIQYCNLAAYPITDSLSQAKKAVIRRTSLKNRNQKNKATKEEQTILEGLAKKAANGQALKPIIKSIDGKKIAFYAPININDFCLNCHGKLGETLTDKNYQLIKNYYPEDKAIGYVSGELRGMWSIQFTK